MLFALRIVLVTGWAISGPGLFSVFVRITSLCRVISASLAWGLGYRLGSSRSLFLGSIFVRGGGSLRASANIGHINWVRPGGKYISRNSQKGVLSNVIIMLCHIMTCACVAWAMSVGECVK